MISPSNPTTNTIQGPNVVMYNGALYYNCYNQGQVCRFNLSTKAVTTVKLPAGTRWVACSSIHPSIQKTPEKPANSPAVVFESFILFPTLHSLTASLLAVFSRYNSKSDFCTLDECYLSSDLDLATDESGIWVIYTTAQDFGNLVLTKVEDTQPPQLGQTWRTSVYKKGMTNTFMVCGVLYGTRYVDKSVEEIFYSFDTVTGEENFNVGVFIHKISPNIQSLNYSPVDQMLHAYCDSVMVSYKVLFS